MCVNRFYLLVLFIFIACSSADSDSDCSKQSSSKSQIARLKKDLMCDYDSTIRPVINEANGTTVSFRMLLKYFTYDVASSTLALDMWMPTFWKDQHLQWKPKDYENITRINFNSYSLWTPDLSVYNRAEQGGDPSAFSYTYCAVTSTGNVLCVPSVHIDALCVPDLSRYPYDVQSCSLRMGSWVYKGEELDIQIYGSVVNTDELEPNGEWEILNTTAKRHPGNHACCPNTTYPSIEILFQIGRLSGAHAASVVIPTIVGMILTFTLLFISPLNQERMVLCYVNLIVQFMHVQYMSWQVPLKGDQIPLLLLLARDSLLMAAFTVVFSLINRSLMQRVTAAPQTISVIVSGTVGNRVGQLLFLNNDPLKSAAFVKGEQDSETIVRTNSKNNSPSEAWFIFGKILDFTLLLVYVITYFILLMKFVP